MLVATPVHVNRDACLSPLSTFFYHSHPPVELIEIVILHRCFNQWNLSRWFFVVWHNLYGGMAAYGLKLPLRSYFVLHSSQTWLTQCVHSICVSKSVCDIRLFGQGFETQVKLIDTQITVNTYFRVYSHGGIKAWALIIWQRMSSSSTPTFLVQTHNFHYKMHTYAGQFIAEMCGWLHAEITDSNGRCQINARE